MPTTAEVCPYCGVSVVPATLENVSASFSPSYRMGGEPQDNGIPRSLYATHTEAEQTEQEEVLMAGDEAVQAIDENQPAIDQFQRMFFATILLLSGSVFFLFGVILWLFSEDGMLTLRWDSTFWFIYAVLALPLLFFGWRYLSQIED